MVIRKARQKSIFSPIWAFWSLVLRFHVIVGCLVSQTWRERRCRVCSHSPKAKQCWQNAGGQIINLLYRRVITNKRCNVIGWKQADVLSGFPAAFCPCAATDTLPHRPHETFSSPGKVRLTKALTFTDRSGAWELRGGFVCSDQNGQIF